jgi:hypothetical protein
LPRDSLNDSRDGSHPAVHVMQSSSPSQLRQRRAMAVAMFTVSASAGAWALGACAEIGTEPDVPGAIEMSPFPSPSVVVGDTLRDLAGKVAPVQAVVRNVGGDVIADASVRYLYADFNRDSALQVDSITGIVVAKKASTGDARIAARVGGSLQVLRTLVVTVRPDTVAGSSVATLLTTVFPDTGRAKATANTTQPLGVTVRNRQTTTAVAVNGWAVRFELLQPANPANDTTRAAWLVDGQGRASVFDTTDAAGSAGRQVRVRAEQFPTAGTDTVVVRAFVTYKGVDVPGSPVRLTAPVKRGTGG